MTRDNRESPGKSPRDASRRLESRLTSVDPDVRAGAVRGLGRKGTPEVIPPLEERAEEDEDLRVRFLARRQLGAIRREASRRLAGQLLVPGRKKGPGCVDREKLKLFLAAGGPPETRIDAVKLVLACGDTQVVDVLQEFAGFEDDPEVTGAYLQALGYLGGGRLVPFLSRYISADSPMVRMSLVKALALTRSTAAYPYVVKLLGDGDSSVVREAFAMIKKLGKTNTINLLSGMIRSRNQWMIAAALKACVLLGKSRRVRAMLEKLEARSSGSLKRRLKQTLERITAGVRRVDEDGARLEGAPSLLSLPSNIESVMEEAASAVVAPPPRGKEMEYLQKIVDQKDVERAGEIVAWLRASADPRFMASCLIALGRLGHPDSAVVIREYLGHSDSRVRANAVEALDLLCRRNGDPALLEGVETALHDENNRVKANAVVALHGLRDVRPALLEMIESGSSSHRRSAVYAVAAIGDPSLAVLLDKLKQTASRDGLLLRQIEEAEAVLREAAEAARAGETKRRAEVSISEREASKVSRHVVLPGLIVGGGGRGSGARASSGSEDGAGAEREARLDGAAVQGGRSSAGKEGGGVWRRFSLEDDTMRLFLGHGEPPAPPTIGEELVNSLFFTVLFVLSMLLFGAVLLCPMLTAWYLLAFLTGSDVPLGIAGAALVFTLLSAEGFVPPPSSALERILRVVGRQDAPQLHAYVQKAADLFRVPRPQQVCLLSSPCVRLLSLSKAPLSPFMRIRALEVGVHALHALEEEELKALFYSEFAFEEQVRGNLFARLVACLQRMSLAQRLYVEAKGGGLAGVNPAGWGLILLRKLSARLAARLWRRLRAAADTKAARIVGAETYCRALTKHDVLQLVMMERFQSGSVPVEQLEELLEALDGRDLQALQRKALSMSSTRWEPHFHIPLKERMSAIAAVRRGEKVSTAGIGASAPARELVRNLDRLISRLRG